GRVTRACRHDEGQLPMAEHPAENTPAPVTAAQSPSAGETSTEPAAHGAVCADVVQGQPEKSAKPKPCRRRAELGLRASGSRIGAPPGLRLYCRVSNDSLSIFRWRVFCLQHRKDNKSSNCAPRTRLAATHRTRSSCSTR